MGSFPTYLVNRSLTVSDHGAGEMRLGETIMRVLADPLGMTRTIQWLGTASRDQFSVSSLGDDLTKHRAEGIVEISIVISKQLRTKLGDEASIGYPNDEFFRIINYLAQKYDCLPALSWAAEKADF